MEMTYEEVCKHVGALFLNMSQQHEQNKVQLSQFAIKIQQLEQENESLRIKLADGK
jgi:hypothetical protein